MKRLAVTVLLVVSCLAANAAPVTVDYNGTEVDATQAHPLWVQSSLGALINIFPTTRGQQIMVNSLGVVVASDQILNVNLATQLDPVNDSINVGKIGAIIPVMDPVLGLGVNVKQSNTEGFKATYSASSVGLVPAAAGTDIFTITGSDTKTVRITRIQISGIATAATAADIVLLKRSTADTLGTAASSLALPVAIPNDSGDAAATAVVDAYVANPTLGTIVGVIRAQKSTLSTPGGAITIVPAIWDFTLRNEKAITLRGAAQQLAINWNAQTIVGNSLNIDISWTEE